MTLTKLKLKPGINKQTSNLGASGTFTDCDNIRFRYGLPEKIGGWDKTTANTLIGVVRDQHAWRLNTPCNVFSPNIPPYIGIPKYNLIS